MPSHREEWGGGSEVRAKQWWFRIGSVDKRIRFKWLTGFHIMARIESQQLIDFNDSTVERIVVESNISGMMVINHVWN